MARKPLTREAILRQAIRIADRDGLDAATLRRIAGDLDVHVTSIYNHIPTKQAVIDGLVEMLITEAKLPIDPVRWQEWVGEFIAAIGTLARTHPGAFVALLRRPVQGPAAARSFEIALSAFREGGFDTDSAYAALKATILSALGFGAEQAGLATAGTLRTDLKALPKDQFPYIHEADAVTDEADILGFLTDSLIAGFSSRRPT